MSQQELADLKSLAQSAHGAYRSDVAGENCTAGGSRTGLALRKLMTALHAAKDFDSGFVKHCYRAQEKKSRIFFVKVEGKVIA